MDPGQARVAAGSRTAHRCCLDKQVGEGHVLLFTSGLENLTNDLPLHPVFVAFVDQGCSISFRHERLGGSQLVDSFVQLRSAAAPAGEVANVEVIDPDGRRPLSLNEARTVQTFRLAARRLLSDSISQMDSDAVIGVNPDRRESDLLPIPQDVQKLWSGNTAGGTPADDGHALMTTNIAP